MAEINLTDLGSKIVTKDGVLGLIALMGMGFIMIVVYRGQQQMQMVHEKLIEISQDQSKKQDDVIQVLQDIRYTLKAGNNVVFRNNPNALPTPKL